METQAHTTVTPYHLLQRVECGPWECVRGDPTDTVPVPIHEPCENATHTSLRVRRSFLSSSKIFSVNLFDGSKGVKVPVKVRSTDTIGKLLQRVQRPDLGENLIYNGKPVQLHQTLSELQVKPDATFLTFQKLGIWECVRGDPKNTVPVLYHEPCGNATHTPLRDQEQDSTSSKSFPVYFFDGSKGVKVPVMATVTDTVGKLLEKVQRPDLGENLTYNGKPVQLHQTLSELQVKPDATFISFQKCRGG